MTTRLSALLAIGAIAAALAIGAAPTADAADAAAQSVAPAAGSAPTQPIAATIPSPSTPVSGVLTDPHGQPLANMEIHFQGRVDPDIFTVRTGAGGAFATVLPPGIYDLRDEHGAIIAADVAVGRGATSIGRVEAPAPLAPTRLFDRQAVSPVIVKTRAPAGAYVPAPGEAPVAVMPVASPPVQGGAGGRAMVPAEVIPTGVEQQLEVPPGAETEIGAPSAGGEMPAPTSATPPSAPQRAQPRLAPPLRSGGY